MDFNIVNYLAGLTAYQLDDRVYERIAMERNAYGITEFSSLSKEKIELMEADILLAVYTGPTTLASVSQSHSGFSQTVGAQTVSDREVLYNRICAIYKKYNDSKLADVESSAGYIEIIDESAYENDC